MLSALKTYQSGRGERGSNSWIPVQAIVDALDSAFYLSFGSVPAPTGNVLLALDVSGSMDGGVVAGIPGLTPRVTSAAMALVTAATAAAGKYHILGFSHRLVDIPITSKTPLNTVIATMQRIPMGRTDCALPMIWARDNKAAVDGFAVYTDSETWHGQIHPCAALREYRLRSSRNARLAVVGMVGNQFTIADPDDAGMLDLIGFDTAAPALMADFFDAAGNS